MELILALLLTLAGVNAPQEDDTLTDTLLNISVAAADAATDCESEEIIERSDKGLYIGAITECDERSFGFFFSIDGTVYWEAQ